MKHKSSHLEEFRRFCLSVLSARITNRFLAFKGTNILREKNWSMGSRFQAIMIGSKILQGFRLNETWVDCRFYEFYSSDHSSRKHDTDKLKSKGNYYEMKPGCLDRVGRVQGLQRQSCAYVMFTHLVHRDMCTQPAFFLGSCTWARAFPGSKPVIRSKVQPSISEKLWHPCMLHWKCPMYFAGVFVCNIFWGYCNIIGQRRDQLVSSHLKSGFCMTCAFGDLFFNFLAQYDENGKNCWPWCKIKINHVDQQDRRLCYM